MATRIDLSDYERQALSYIAEEMAGLVFDDRVLERFQALGLAERATDSWTLTEAGKANLSSGPSREIHTDRGSYHTVQP